MAGATATLRPEPWGATIRFQAVPELPDVENYRRYLERHALRLPIADVRVSDPRVLDGCSEQRLRRRLIGAHFDSTARHGKHLLAHLDTGGWLAMHFGMTGALGYFEDAQPEPSYTRMRIDFDRDRHLAYTDPRLLGRIALAKEGEADVFFAAHGLGPDALDPNFDLDAFETALRGSGALKAALMDQGRIAGIGNLYADEILFQAGLHPRARFETLTEKQIRGLFRTTRQVLKTAVARGAGAEDFVGRLPEGYLLRSRQKDGTCPRGHGPLETLRIGGRTAYFCPQCQPAP